MELVRVLVQDEENNRALQFFLTPEQRDRACSDESYVDQLLQEHDINENEEARNYARLLANNDESLHQLPVGESVSGRPRPQEHNRNHSAISEAGIVVGDDANPEAGIVDDENSEPRSLFIWTDSCIQLLLSLYEEHKADFQVKRHKKVYDDIAKRMRSINEQYTMNGSQCQSKLNSLKKMYKKVLDHNSTSGNDRATWPYFNRMDELFGSTGWARPVATASEDGPDNNDTLTVLQSPKNSNKRKLDTTFEEYVKEKKKHCEEKARMKQDNINKLLEQREQHHKEKMEFLRAIHNSLTRQNNTVYCNK